MCEQPTQWWNPVDANCYYSAVGLAQRFSQGDSQAYTAWFDVLIKKDWGELKVIEAWGSAAGVTGASRKLLDDAAIIPRLFREDPRAALLALDRYACQNQGTFLGYASLAIVATAQSLTLPAPTIGVGAGEAVEGGASTGGIGVAVGLGILLAVGGLIAWDELTKAQEKVEPMPNQDDPCLGLESCIIIEDKILRRGGSIYYSTRDAKQTVIGNRKGIRFGDGRLSS